MNFDMPLWVGITTLPSRITLLQPTLDSLINQTKKPDKIYLSLPWYSIREKSEYVLPQWLSNYEQIEVIRCNKDYGPGTKLLGCLDRLQEAGCLVIADDDMIYRPFFLRNIYEAQTSNHYCSFSYWTYKLGPITVGQGADGFSFYTPNLSGIMEYSKTIVENQFIRVVDDLWISAYLKKFSIKVESIRNTIPDDKDVYIKVHEINQLQNIETHLNRDSANDSALKFLLSHGYLGVREQFVFWIKSIILKFIKNPRVS